MILQKLVQEWKGKTWGQRRALCEQLTGPDRGWFQACRAAVQAEEEALLRLWLENPDATQQAILQALGPMADLHLRCAWAARWAQGLVSGRGRRRICCGPPGRPFVVGPSGPPFVVGPSGPPFVVGP